MQKILADNGMDTRSDRLLKLEEQHCQKAIELPAEQVALIERANPCFRVGRVCLQPVVDTIGSYAFGFLRTAKLPEGRRSSVAANQIRTKAISR